MSQEPPYEFTTDWFTSREALWQRLLGPLRGGHGLRFLEIGTFEGRSAAWLLENVLTHPTAHLTCIDPFCSDRPVYRGVDFAVVRGRWESNLARFGDRVSLIQQTSAEALRGGRIADCTIDLAYIDGSHLARDVIEDAVLVWRLLKRGAVLIFDDYGWSLDRSPQNCLRLAIDAFLDIYAGCYRLLHKGYQVAIEKG